MRMWTGLMALWLTGCGGTPGDAAPEPAAQLTAGHDKLPERAPEKPGFQLAFLMSEDTSVDTDAVVEAARKVGIQLSVDPENDREVLAFDIAGGGSLLVAPIDVPHPDAARMPTNPMSPSEAERATCKAHFIVTVLGLTGDVQAVDARMAKLTAAVVQGTTAKGAMLYHTPTFLKADLFADFALSAEPGELPVFIGVGFTLAPEPDGRMSVLSHGMQRYGREELYVTASQQGSGAISFFLDMVGWLYVDTDKVLPTGDTVGRTAEEKVKVQRVPSPTGEGPEVIRLDLP